ncbi:MAG: phage virion morphogenesis protein [Tagaea sp.]|nr:phage virion morphogenesis protein [Tagaea sp.]
MAGVSLPVIVDRVALSDIGAKLDRLRRRLDDMIPVHDTIGDSLVASTLDRFERGVDPKGAAWAPSLRVLEGGGQTLIDRGHLRQSVHHRAERDRVTVGSNSFYAAIHQFGGKAGRNRAATIPARPFIGLSDGDKTKAGKIVEDFLAAPMGGPVR